MNIFRTGVFRKSQLYQKYVSLLKWRHIRMSIFMLFPAWQIRQKIGEAQTYLSI